MNFVCIVFELGDKMLTLSSMENLIVQCNLLAHLRQRLMGELIGYPWSGVRPSVVRCRRPSVVHNAQRSSSPKPLC